MDARVVAKPHRRSTCEIMDIRGLRYNVRRWGTRGGRPLLFAHGVQDAAITFQFLVDHLGDGWDIVAPDWRGHGETEWASAHYWFHEFVADLDILADRLFPREAMVLVGHSLGGNIAGIYAGLRPERVSHLISLDGFGPLVDRVPVDVLELMSGYLEVLRSERQHSPYADLDAIAQRLARANDHLGAAEVAFLAPYLSVADADGQFRWRFDPTLHRSLPVFHTVEEWARVWSALTMPILWISSNDTREGAPVNFPDEMRRRAMLTPGVRHVALPGTHHNLQHDRPAEIAAMIEAFVAEPETVGTPGYILDSI